MFSYFKDGIKSCVPNGKLTIERLVKFIRVNNAPTINAIRSLDHNAHDYKKAKSALKGMLSYITPNCTVSYRSDDSIREFSGYMYFDIDNCDDAIFEKADLINNYKDQILMVCLSVSGRGLSFFVKIENEMTESNFYAARKYLSEVIFSDLNLDSNTSAISNAWFISYDADCYYNPTAIVEVSDSFLSDIYVRPKGANDTIITPSNDIVSNALYVSTVDIKEVMSVLKFRTEVDIQNQIFDVTPLEYCEVVFPKEYRIPDGRKKSVFTQVIHSLIYLNPDIDSSYIISYLIWLNEHRAVTPGSRNDVARWFNWVNAKILSTGELKPKLKTKYFHCKRNIVPADIRIKLARKLTNLYKSNETIEQISLAKQIISLQKSANDTIIYLSNDIVSNAPFKKATQTEVFKLINERAAMLGVKGAGIRTIKKYWNEAPMDMETLIEKENLDLLSYLGTD